MYLAYQLAKAPSQVKKMAFTANRRRNGQISD